MSDIIKENWSKLNLKIYSFLAENDEATKKIQQYFLDNGGHPSFWNDYETDVPNMYWKYAYARGIDNIRLVPDMPSILHVRHIKQGLSIPNWCQTEVDEIDLDEDERFSIGFDCFRLEGYLVHGGMFVVYTYSEEPDMIYIFPKPAQEFLSATALCFDEWIKSESDFGYADLRKESPTKTLLNMSLSVAVSN